MGVGAWSAGIFHFMIHAFFKALLFLAAGAVILALHHEQNMFNMGGLRKKLPVIFWTFLIGSASLAALPLITAGFFSKDSILWFAYSSIYGSIWFWLAGFVGAFITAVYSFRMVFIVFFGEAKTQVHYQPGIIMILPLIILAFFAIFGGFIQLPENIGHIAIFSTLIEKTLPHIFLKTVKVHEWIFQILSAIVSIIGVYFAYLIFLKKSVSASIPGLVQQYFLSGWNFDKLYDILFVKPFIKISEFTKPDRIDRYLDSFGELFNDLGKVVAIIQNGRLNWYLTGIIAGLIIVITLLIYL
jgi:NADH-quinone oxidoreductase subunit L